MPRCGCGDECNCSLQGGVGVGVNGTGAPNDPYRLRFDGNGVAGNGLTWIEADQKLAVRISPGTGLDFDAAGALRNTGGGGGGGGNLGWTTVADLEARNMPIVIGHTGAGYFIKPETALRSYEYGQQVGLDMMHVPVRMLSDGRPVVHSDENLGRIVGEPWNTAAWTTQYVQEYDVHRWGIVPMLSGLDNPYLRNQPDGNTEPTVEFGAANWANAKWQTRSPSFGTLGWRERPQYGGTFLADVLRSVGGRTPLVIDLRFPARNAQGGWIQDTPPWRTDLFLRNVLLMLQRFGLTQYTVITSTELIIPAQAAGENVDILSMFANAGFRVGPTMTATRITQYTPANWPSIWSWAFFHNTLTDAQIAPYVPMMVNGKKLVTIMLQVQRQAVWQRRITTPGLKGATSNDPPYAAGLAMAAHAHSLAGLGYRRNFPRFADATMLHGLLPPTDAPQRVTSWWRGTTNPGVEQVMFGPTMVPSVAGTTYYVLQGWGAPIPIPTDVSFDLQMFFDQFESPRSQSAWLAFAFCRNTDDEFADWNPAPGSNVDAQSGYAFMMTHRDTGADAVNPNCYLYGYQGGAVQTMGTARTLTPVTASTPKRFRIGINNRGIRISAVQADNSLVTLIETRTDLAKAYRGGYFLFGRFSQGGQGWYGGIKQFTYTTLQGAADGPQ